MRDTEYLDTEGYSRNGHKPQSIDRLPPHSQEAEQCVLGCILIDAQQSLPDCIEKLKSGGETFYDLRHQSIYETFIELYEDNDPIDVVSVSERLRAWDKLDQVGGSSYLASLPDAVPSVLNLPHYLEIVHEKYIMRRMVQVCTEVVGRVYNHQGDADELLDTCERDILRISEARVESPILTMPVLVHAVIDDIERAHNNPNDLSGLATGFTDFDRLTGGLMPGDMILIAARPSMGKTSLAMNIVEHVACDLHLPVGVCSLEMTAKQLTSRMLCSRARVNIKNMRDGFLAERDFPKLTAASITLTHAPIYIDDKGGQSILQIRAKMRRWVQQHGIKVGVIDYLQLANALGGKRKFESRQQEVSDVSVGIKNLAKELGIPIIALSQMNRDYEKEKNRKPRLSDLRESGSLEQDSDVVTFLYKPHNEHDDDCQDYSAAPVNLLIAKQRNGPSNVDVNLTFLKCFTRFESAYRVSDDDIPPEHQPQPALPYADNEP